MLDFNDIFWIKIEKKEKVLTGSTRYATLNSYNLITINDTFKREPFCCDIPVYSTYLPKASLHKGGGQLHGPPPFVGNHLLRLACEGYVGYEAMWRQKPSLLNSCLLKCRSHFKRESFKKGPMQVGQLQHTGVGGGLLRLGLQARDLHGRQEV